MFGQRHRADAITDHLAVQGQGAGQQTGLCLQPLAQTPGKLIGIQPDQNLVKHIVTRYPVKASTARFTWKAQCSTLLRVQSGGKAGDLGNVACAGQNRHGNQRQHCTNAKLRVLSPGVRRMA
jgi:hypothetical protein